MLSSKKSKTYPAILRGGAIDPYYDTIDGLFIEYDFDR